MSDTENKDPPEGEESDRKRKSSRRSRSASGSREKKKSRRSRSRDRDRDRDRSRDSGSRSKDRDRRSSRRRSRSPSVDDEAEKKRKEQEAEREANRDEYTVFVAQIHPKVDERDLFEFFSHVGRVEDIRLIRDQRTQKSKGLAYIEFWEKDSVGKAVTLTGQLLGGYPITISITLSDKQSSGGGEGVGETSMRLYVGQLHENVTDSDLKPVFEAFGEIDFIDLHKDSAGKSKGFGFVQYKSESDARAALEALNGLDIAGKNIQVGIVDASNEGPGKGELDEEGTGGMALNAASRAALMAKLGRGTAMPTFPGASMAAPATGSTGVMSATNLAVPLIQPSTCIIVKNMFDPKTETEVDFDLDIKEDVEEEALKFGKLKHIFVDKNSQGYVYIRYELVEGAKGLVGAFNGRWFASRQISAEFVVESIYLAKFPQAK